MGFLITKELNKQQVRQVEMLIKYYFIIEYTKGTDNAGANALSQIPGLQVNREINKKG